MWRGFIVMIPYMSTVSFEQVYLPHYFSIPPHSYPIFQTVFGGFHYPIFLCVCVCVCVCVYVILWSSSPHSIILCPLP
jgi:hypothetical protein